MSVAEVTARVEELHALFARPVGSAAATASGAAATTAFAGALTSASPSATAATGVTATAALAPAPPGAPSGGTGEDAYDGLITAAARRNRVDPALLKALIRQESGFDPSAGSPAGAQGLSQLMPGTAAALGVADTLDPAQSIEGGAKYLSQQLKTFGGDASLALAAYNAGPGAVQRYGGVPPYAETQQYVQKVLGYANAYRGSLA